MDDLKYVHIEKLPKNFTKKDYEEMVIRCFDEPIEKRISIIIEDLDSIREINSSIANLYFSLTNVWRSIDLNKEVGLYRIRKVKKDFDKLVDSFDKLVRYWHNGLFLNIYGSPVIKPYKTFRQNLDSLHTRTIFDSKWNQIKRIQSKESKEEFFKKMVFKALYQILIQVVEFFKFDLYMDIDINKIGFDSNAPYCNWYYGLIHRISNIVNDLNITVLARLHHINKSGKDVDEYEQKINQLEESFRKNKEIIDNINKIENKSKRKVCSCNDKQMEINKTICEYLDVVDGKCKKENIGDDRVVEVVQSLEKKIDQVEFLLKYLIDLFV